MHAAIAIQLDQAAKTFGARPGTGSLGERPAAPARPAVAGVSLAVRLGEIFGLIGPNGSGKSTLLSLIASQLLPDAGQIRVLGHDVAAAPRAVQSVTSRLATEPSFFKKLSAVENLLHGARLSGVRPGDTRRRVLAMLARLGLSEAEAYRPLETLSRGLQQRVAIGRACLGEPRVLLLDEPTASLDPRARREVHTLVRDLRAEHGTTVVLATQDLAEAEALCDRVAIVEQGRLTAVDTPAGLLRRTGQASLEEAFLALTAQPAERETVCA